MNAKTPVSIDFSKTSKDSKSGNAATRTDQKQHVGFESFVRAAMSTGKPPPMPKKTKAKKRKGKK